MLYLGLDVGSTTSKCVLLSQQDGGLNPIGRSLVVAGIGTDGAQQAVDQVLQKAGYAQTDLAAIVATGYGRKIYPHADRQMSELSCHAKGVATCFPKARTVIDIGGQDAKVLALGENGQLQNFLMNDKCAAGTGRFLDVMANILKIDVSEIETLANQAEKPVQISSTCTVFAESEVISQLASGQTKEAVLAGVCESVAARVGALAKRIGLREQVVMSGGVARNGAVRRALERHLSVEIQTSDWAQYMGAYGAAIYAANWHQKQGRQA